MSQSKDKKLRKQQYHLLLFNARRCMLSGAVSLGIHFCQLLYVLTLSSTVLFSQGPTDLFHPLLLLLLLPLRPCEQPRQAEPKRASERVCVLWQEKLKAVRHV